LIPFGNPAWEEDVYIYAHAHTRCMWSVGRFGKQWGWRQWRVLKGGAN
jgi:hypothetical protein